ncbi:MAG: PKD domain-containing protein [Ardenticatenaceae bacterium]|nr:PKD domain-containing protein [Ardenticatenaceae bacterium]
MKFHKPPVPFPKVFWLLLLIVTLIFSISLFNAAAAGPSQIYLPLIRTGVAEPFTPTSDTTLNGGNYIFSEFIIPANVTVTVSGNVSILVQGTTDIAGILTADCTTISINSQGDFIVTGAVDNACSGDDTNAGDLILHKTGNGKMHIGTETAVAHLDSSGNVDISNDPTIQEWEFDVLPHQRAASLTPPACLAEANTVIGATGAGFPLEIAFFGDGADPDGGPISYHWNFGDGHTASEKEPLHTYTSWGEYSVTLTVTDNDSQSCVATIHLTLTDDSSNNPPAPGNWQSPATLVAATGEAILLSSGADDPLGEALTFAWEFGDSLSSNLPAPTHTYNLPGVYPITLTVTNESGYVATATSSIYIYDGSTAPQPQVAQGGACIGAGALRFNVNYNRGQADPGKNGRTFIVRGRGNAWVGPGSIIQAQHGGNGDNRVGAGFVQGGHGGKGGSLQILVNGTLTICTGASLSAGNGGNGGNATSITPAPGHAHARGGRGGRAASLFRISATQGITINNTAGGNMTINPGNGGNGGAATATGGPGDDGCNTAENGATATARGGNGGRASKSVTVTGNIVGIGNILVIGGRGGSGGVANATGGNGGEADCLTTAVGGNSGWATAFGGSGGDAKLHGNAGGMILDPTAFTAGAGGAATAISGNGGKATANPSADCEDTTASGGHSDKASAYGGRGGKGLNNATGGNATATGGVGGDATAYGGDCPGCGNQGGDATATSGNGGDAHARPGRGEPDGAATALGGNAGTATANGGRGGDCDECPGGDGGPGGDGNANGGSGGNATGGGNDTGGEGGTADAWGGDGGWGANCECDKFVQEAGGDGGDGGLATAVAGNGGLPAGPVGETGGSGGGGGNGGNGLPPGAGGAGGIGSGDPEDIPDGLPGDPGAACEIEYVIWYIYHSSIPDGPILPDTIIPLETFTQTVPVNPTGVVPLRFMNPTELGFPPLYFKNGAQLQVHGGLEYSFAEIPPSQFPIISFEARNVAHSCPNPECIILIGYSQGIPVGAASNQLIGPGSVETLTLPAPPPGVLYDQVQFISLVPMSFLHWEIVIIDP